MPFCQPPSLVEDTAGLGTLLEAEPYQSSPFVLSALKNETCKLLCIVPNFADQGESSHILLRLLKEGDYAVKLRVDGRSICSNLVSPTSRLSSSKPSDK